MLVEGASIYQLAIIPFCTHEGSALGHSESYIKKLCPDSKVLSELAIRGSSVHGSEKDISRWINKLNEIF